MKIGIAYCGNSKMACFARYIGEWVRSTGLRIEAETVTSLAATSFILDSRFIFENYSVPQVIYHALLENTSELKENTVATAVDVPTGKYVSLCKELQPSGGEFVTLQPTFGGFWAAGCLPPFGNLPSLEFAGYKLCDSSIGWGCPYIPLASLGVDRMITVIFPSEIPEYPYIISADKMARRTAQIGEYMIEVNKDSFACFEDAKEYVNSLLEENKKPLLHKILFYE